MTLFQFFIGFILVAVWALRPFLYRPAAKYFPPKTSSAFTSTWLIIVLFSTFPIFKNLLTNDYTYIFHSIYILISIYKGVSLYYLIELQQVVNKESTSSSVFLSFIALALGCLANNLFFGEGLGYIKVLSISGFGLLGIIFLIEGDAKRISMKAKIAFFIVSLILASYVVSDHISIKQIGWYPHLFVSSVIMFLTALIHGISKQDFKNMFLNKGIVIAGLVYAISEFFVIFASINILPVSIVGVFLRLSVPIVMIISAIRYHEQSLKNQLIFGISAILLALPIILIK